jgi:hypothetical protein
MKYGNEPGVQKIEISQAGSVQQNACCPVTNVIAHRPGVKLLDGLAQASTNGETTYAYHCRASCFKQSHAPYWTRFYAEFLTVIDLATDQLALLLG